jgi:hypothetical protein
MAQELASMAHGPFTTTHAFPCAGIEVVVDVLSTKAAVVVVVTEATDVVASSVVVEDSVAVVEDVLAWVEVAMMLGVVLMAGAVVEADHGREDDGATASMHIFHPCLPKPEDAFQKMTGRIGVTPSGPLCPKYAWPSTTIASINSVVSKDFTLMGPTTLWLIRILQDSSDP